MAPVPFCAVCQHAVERYVTTKDCYGRLVFTCYCHGETDQIQIDLNMTALISLEDESPVAFQRSRLPL